MESDLYEAASACTTIVRIQ